MTEEKKAEHDREETPGSSPRVTVRKTSPNVTGKRPRVTEEKKAEHDKEKKARQFHTEKKRRFSEPQAERHIGSGVHGTAGALGHAAADGTVPVGGVGKNGRLNENPVQKIKAGSEL